MEERLEKRMAGIAEGPDWSFIKKFLLKERDKFTDLEELETEGDLLGAKKASKIIDEVVRKFEGAREALDFKKSD